MLLMDGKEMIKKIQEDKGIFKYFERKVDYIRNRKTYEDVSYYFIKNTPSYFEDNVMEWIEGKPFSDIEIDGITINQILSLHKEMNFLEALDAVIMLHNEFISAEKALSDSYRDERKSMFPMEEDVCTDKIILIGNYSIDKKVKLSKIAERKVFERLVMESCLNHKALFKYMMEDCLPELEPNLIEWAKGESLSDIMVGNLSPAMLLKSWNSSELNYAFTKLKYYKKEGCPEAIEFHILAGWKY